VTVIILSALYNDKEFVRVGYYVAANWESEEYATDVEEGRKVGEMDGLVRNVKSDTPRVTRFSNKWWVQRGCLDFFPRLELILAASSFLGTLPSLQDQLLRLSPTLSSPPLLLPTHRRTLNPSETLTSRPFPRLSPPSSEPLLLPVLPLAMLLPHRPTQAS
jgi:hypothetical protein